MARTNKQWIAAKKAQLSKQANRLKWQKRFDYPKRKLSLEDGKDFWAIAAKQNPVWKTYHRFLRWRKICRETRMRIDPDGYRLVKMPSGWLEFVQAPTSWYTRKKLMKNNNAK